MERFFFHFIKGKFPYIYHDRSINEVDVVYKHFEFSLDCLLRAMKIEQFSVVELLEDCIQLDENFLSPFNHLFFRDMGLKCTPNHTKDESGQKVELTWDSLRVIDLGLNVPFDHRETTFEKRKLDCHRYENMRIDWTARFKCGLLSACPLKLWIASEQPPICLFHLSSPYAAYGGPYWKSSKNDPTILHERTQTPKGYNDIWDFIIRKYPHLESETAVSAVRENKSHIMFRNINVVFSRHGRGSNPIITCEFEFDCTTAKELDIKFSKSGLDPTTEKAVQSRKCLSMDNLCIDVYDDNGTRRFTCHALTENSILTLLYPSRPMVCRI